jgi:alpha-galactosidase
MKSFLPIFVILFFAGRCAVAQSTPPMGWNSWDSYATTINEQQFRGQAGYMAAHLKSFGWQYVVIDEEWFVANPKAEGNDKGATRVMDAYGRYIPASNRFPSSVDGAGFAALAAYIHSLGLKFGIHVLQGIPREAVEHNLPIEGTTFHATDAANTSATCPWNSDNYGLKPTAAGQAYYDSTARLYASWGVDLVKIDCIASRPFKGDEIDMFHRAIEKTGRPILISLSPGEPPFDEVAFMQANSNLWRVSNDVWDLWHSKEEYPQGVVDQFPRAQRWIATQQPRHWPDLDMLAIGRLGPAPGWGVPRESRLSHDEERTLLTLWSMFRSPLMVGGDLPSMDPWTLSLLTNAAVLEVDQRSRDNKCVLLTSSLSVWTARPAAGSDSYVALFNLTEQSSTLHYSWKELGFSAPRYETRNLWDNTLAKSTPALSVRLAPHASVLLRVTPHR